MVAKLTKRELVRISRHRAYGTGEVIQYEVIGYPPGQGAAIAQLRHKNWSVMRWTVNEQTPWMGDFATPDEALAVLEAWFREGDSSMITRTKIEGTLDVVWMNFERPFETPVYFLNFYRYPGVKNGTQKHKEIHGKDALKTYLQGVGCGLIQIYALLSEIDRAYFVNLTNVVIGGYEYAMSYRN